MRFLVNWSCSKEQALEELSKPRDTIAIDIETVNLENQLPLGIGVGLDRDKGVYFYNTKDPLLGQILSNAKTVIAHNAKFDIPKLKELDHKVERFEDTRTLAYANGIMELSLDSLSGDMLLRECPSVTSLWRKSGTGNIGVNHIDLGNICIIHATNTYALWEKLDKVELYQDIDRPYLDLIIEMEQWGLSIDQYALTKVDHETTIAAKKIELELYEDLGQINLGSNPQVAKALQDRGIIGTRKTKAGADSVSDDSLAPLNNPTANKLLEWRRLMKTLTTYVPAFRAVDYRGRLHTQFGYTETGRLTSSKPNLQNISNNGLRDCIIPDRGYTLISLDASQLELRVVAILSQDPLMLKALESEDLHLATAIQVFGYTEDKEEMSKRRYNAKQINFAVLYGASEFKIAEMANCSVIEAEELIRQYFNTYSVLDIYIKEERKKAKRNGYVTNLFSRKRPLPDLFSTYWKFREKGEREVINTIVQGTAADIVKLIQMYLRDVVDPEVRMILQVHDEILMEVPDGLVQDTLTKIKELPLAFPQYPCTVKVGKNYGKLEKVEV